MHEIQIAHASIHQRLERRQSNALEKPRRQQTLVIPPGRARPHGAEDDDHGAEEVEVSFSPDTGGGDEDEAC